MILRLQIPPAAPANVAFANRTVIRGVSVLASGTNSGATDEVGELHLVYDFGGKSAWWPVTDVDRLWFRLGDDYYGGDPL